MGEPRGVSYKIVEVAGKGLGMIATRDLFPGELILAETPIFHVDLDTSRNPQLYMDAKFQEANEKLASLAKRFSHLEGAEKYPPEARAALDQHAALAAEHEFAKLSSVSQARVMALADAFMLRPQATVVVANLSTDRGKMFNGKIGTATEYKSETGLWQVSFSENASDWEYIKAENLVGLAGQQMSKYKSVGGVFRTNALLGMSICENLCRVNHSCRPNAMWQPIETAEDIHLARRLAAGFAELVEMPPPNISMGDHLLFTTSDISAGSEILISYLPDDAELSISERRESLKRYNFVCSCEACSLGSDGIASAIAAYLTSPWAVVLMLLAFVVFLAEFGLSSRRLSAEL